MWEIKEHFKDYSAQQRTAKFLLETGLNVKDGEIYCNGVKMSPSRIGRVLDVDRRTVGATVDTIENSDELSKIFSKLRATAFYKEIAKEIDAGLIEIIPDDPHTVGILAGVATKISEMDISIRQCITEDPEFTEEAKLYVITESPVPGDLVDDIKNVEGVESVVIH
ncbi:MAG: amino acid-binding ACT domain protein [Candidatus Thermoplasmatota archaeon]|nr:amino acid-binding ACT domain protein [Candidatus Thermoplasmatota archaeon]MBS3789967.1 amino acid-binding ACT domain protein [Candidatus Thermoplasmatota archaeon]